MRHQTLITGRDRHILVALVLLDLYMREKVLLHTLLVDVAQASNKFRQARLRRVRSAGPALRRRYNTSYTIASAISVVRFEQ